MSGLRHGHPTRRGIGLPLGVDESSLILWASGGHIRFPTSTLHHHHAYITSRTQRASLHLQAPPSSLASPRLREKRFSRRRGDARLPAFVHLKPVSSLPYTRRSQALRNKGRRQSKRGIKEIWFFAVLADSKTILELVAKWSSFIPSLTHPLNSGLLSNLFENHLPLYIPTLLSNNSPVESHHVSTPLPLPSPPSLHSHSPFQAPVHSYVQRVTLFPSFEISPPKPPPAQMAFLPGCSNPQPIN